MVHRSHTMDDDRFRAPGAPPPSPWAPATPPSPSPSPSPGTIPGWVPPPPQPGSTRRLLAVVAVLVAAFVVFSIGVTVGQAGAAFAPGGPPAWSPSAERPDWQLLDEAWDLLDQHYVDPEALDPLDVERGAIVGMTESLDDRGHTGYLTPEEVKARDDSLSGTFVGIGAVLDQQDGRLVIVRVLADSPAERAGVQAGDEIVSVDGVEMAGMSVDDAVTRIRGP